MQTEKNFARKYLSAVLWGVFIGAFLLFESMSGCVWDIEENTGLYNVNPEFVPGRILDLQMQALFLDFSYRCFDSGFWWFAPSITISCLMARYSENKYVASFRRGIKLTGLILLFIWVLLYAITWMPSLLQGSLQVNIISVPALVATLLTSLNLLFVLSVMLGISPFILLNACLYHLYMFDKKRAKEKKIA